MVKCYTLEGDSTARVDPELLRHSVRLPIGDEQARQQESCVGGWGGQVKRETKGIQKYDKRLIRSVSGI